MHLLWDCGEAASLLPPIRARAVYKRKTQKDSARAPQQVQEPADSPWGAQLSSCSQPKPLLSGFPLLSIYYYYYVQVVLHQKTLSPPLSALQLQPHVCLSALLVPQNLPPVPGCRGEQSMRVAIRQERLHHPPPSPNPSPLPHTHPLPAPLAARTVRKGQVTRRPPPRDGGGWRQEVLPPPVGGGHSDGGWDLQRACSPPRSGRR